MNKHVFHYRVTPSVVRADSDATVTIHPLGENVAFKQGSTYYVRFAEVETGHADFTKALNAKAYQCQPNEQGDIVVTHHFRGEQRHAIFISRPEEDQNSPHYDINNRRRKNGENTVATICVYSLYEDLYGLRPFKGEVHCHTFESDGTQDAIHTVGNYRNAGYDFMAITDHFTSFASEKAMRVFRDAPVDMTLMLGEEVHVPTEHIHAVHLGGSQSVNQYFRDHADEARAEVAEIVKTLTLPEDVPVEDYAWRIWIANKSHEFGGLSILAHPHWVWCDVYFMGESTTRQLLRDGVHDALDLTDGEFDASLNFWADMCAQGVKINLVGSTDSHRTEPTDPHKPARDGGGYTVVFAPDRSPEAIKDAIRQGRSLCVNSRYAPELVVGDYRLAKYTRFLLDHYYPVYKKLCDGQGTVMWDYPVEGKPDAALETLLGALNARSEAFAREFFGY